MFNNKSSKVNKEPKNLMKENEEYDFNLEGFGQPILPIRLPKVKKDGITRFLDDCKGKVMILFKKDFDDGDYVYIIDIFEIGESLILKVAEVDGDETPEEASREYYQYINWKDIEELTFFKSNQD